MNRSIVRKKTAVLIALVATVSAAGLALADGFSTPEGMVCEETVVARYHAGPRWSAVDSVIGEHLAFMRREMQRGAIVAAGPFHESGGLEIHRGSDVAAVAGVVDRDPLVVRRVVTYSLEPWWMCRPAAR